MSEDKATLSPSRANDYLNCPLLYRFRTIDKLPEPPSIDAIRGTLVHLVLEKLFTYPRGERNFTLVRADLHPLWSEMKETRADVQELLPVLKEEEFLLSAHTLLERYFSLEDPTGFEPSELEAHVEINLSDELMIHGYIDRLDIAPTGEIRIVDYKTGKSPKPGWEEKALFQLRVYALLYWKNTGVLPRLLQLIYLGDGRVVKSNPTQVDVESVEKVLRRVAKDIFVSIEKEYWPPKPSRLCDWCYFKEICPAHND